MAGRKKVLFIYGTRPEAIKLAPVIADLRADTCPAGTGRADTGIDVVTAVTGQHREMLDEVNAVFGIVPDHDLDLFKAGQSLPELTSRSVTAVTGLLERVQPDLVVLQGDTSTAFTAGLAAFYAQVPIVHVEAGLRTGDLRHPFPEEANRRLLARITDLHLAPTPSARDNLLREAVDPSTIYVTGNTVIDALLRTVRMPVPPPVEALATAAAGRQLVLVTAHRRESWGTPMQSIAQALATLAAREDVFMVLAAHRNPIVRADLLAPLQHLANVRITEPLAYPEFCHLLRLASVILTDSGGVQEEAPSVGTPVVVLRQTTERHEAIDAGVAQLVGTGTADIVQAAQKLLDAGSDRPSVPMVNPFGDGNASARVVSAVKHFLGRGEREPEFLPATG